MVGVISGFTRGGGWKEAAWLDCADLYSNELASTDAHIIIYMHYGIMTLLTKHGSGLIG